MSSRIEWTHPPGTTGEGWNPVSGCTKVSTGCAHCYAEAFAHRQMGPWKGRAFCEVRCHEDRLTIPLHWRSPRTVFVNSMGDLFHEAVPDTFIDRVFAVMSLCPQHMFVVLTKRPERMQEYVAHRDRKNLIEARWPLLGESDKDLRWWPLPNVILGVSVEDQPTADQRLPVLVCIGEQGWRTLTSIEPLLAPIDISPWLYSGYTEPPQTDRIGWILIGGESGPHARPCDVAWIRAIVRQCRRAGCACFVKQLGAYPRVEPARLRRWEWGEEIGQPDSEKRFTQDGPLYWRLHLKNRKGGDPSELPKDLRTREWPEVMR